MRSFATFMLSIWSVVAIILFAMVPPRVALLVTYIGGWLVLPVTSLSLPGLPDFNKAVLVSVAAIIGAVLFDFNRLMTFRFRWLDVPMTVFFITPFCSSISNDLGAYDGASALLTSFFQWFLPYYLGRIYFPDVVSARLLAVGVTLAGVAYIPVCLWEMRMSPQLHYWAYGFRTWQWATALRFEGYRPVGFLQHGIELGILMMVTSLTGVWLWMSGNTKQLLKYPVSWVVGTLVVVMLMCRAMGGWALFGVGLLALYWTRLFKSRWPILIVIMLPLTYVGVRVTGAWEGGVVLEMVHEIDPERALSLYSRLTQDGLLSQKALQRPFFGWGGWGRQRILDESGKDTSVTDGFWVIIVGQRGLVGLSSWIMALLLPSILLWSRAGVNTLMMPVFAPVTVFSVLLPLIAMDWMLNAFMNPMYLVMSGAIVSTVYSYQSTLKTGQQRYVVARPRRMSPSKPPTG